MRVEIFLVVFRFALVLPLVGFWEVAEGRLNVGTTTQDLEAIVVFIGQDQVDTFSVVKGTQDPHAIEAKPSFMVKFSRADLIISQGLDLEAAWLESLIRGSRNSKIAVGSKGALEIGALLDPLEVPTGPLTRAKGDVHPGGNPHYQLDPIRLGKAALLIAERMGELDGSHRDLYQANALKFQKQMEEKEKEWQLRIKKTGIKEVVTYHKSFSYFLQRFGIHSEFQLEPKPGIPPSTAHILAVVEQMKAKKIAIVLIENFFDDSIKSKLQNEISNLKVARIPVYVGGEPGIKTNEQLIEKIVTTLESLAK